MRFPSLKSKAARNAAIALVVAAGGAGSLIASDHQDTPEVELNPRMDINDVYAFPGATAERIVLAMTTSSPIQGTSAAFDPSLLYQFRIDNTGDAVEDLVIQATFEGTGVNQRVSVHGPLAPTMTGTMSKLDTDASEISGAVGSVLGSANAVQVFAGLRDDPFFLDLEQFFRILPDRRPSTGPLSGPSTPEATAFRNPGVDFLRQFNALAIVVELPRNMLTTSTAADAKLGVWATVSR